MVTFARWIVERHRQHQPVPEQHTPIMKVVELTDGDVLVIEDTGVLTMRRSVVQGLEKLDRGRLVRRSDLQVVGCGLREDFPKLMEVEPADDFPCDSMEAITFKAFRNQTWRK